MNREEKPKLVTLIPYKSRLEETLTDLNCNVIHLAESKYPAGMLTIIDMAPTWHILLLKVTNVKVLRERLRAIYSGRWK